MFFKQIQFIVFFCLFIIFSQAEAKNITGEGFGNTREEAKKAALSDLSSAIQVDVQSSFESIIKSVDRKTEEFARNMVTLKSELPILGATYQYFQGKNDIHAKVMLDSRDSLPLYEVELKRLEKNIENDRRLITDSASRSYQYKIYTEILTHLKQYYKYRTVAILLGSQSIPNIPITEMDIREELNQLKEQVDDLNMAAMLIAEGLAHREKIYIYPPTLRLSHEITPFADAIKKRLSAHLHTVFDPNDAAFYLKGEYALVENGQDGVDLVYYLLDGTFNTLQTSLVSILPKAYSGYDIEPKTLQFDKLLYEGFAVSNEFKIEVTTNLGRESLLFKQDEEVTFLIKMNRPGYFYLIGHVMKQGDKAYSYLVDLDDTGEIKDKRKFVRYVNIDDVNRWLSLGSFEMVPPFGVESVQLIASSKDLVDSLPNYRYDPKTTLCVISENPSEAVLNTRGIKKKISKTVRSAEAVLLFTTMKK